MRFDLKTVGPRGWIFHGTELEAVGVTMTLRKWHHDRRQAPVVMPRRNGCEDRTQNGTGID